MWDNHIQTLTGTFLFTPAQNKQEALMPPPHFPLIFLSSFFSPPSEILEEGRVGGQRTPNLYLEKFGALS